MNFLVDANLPPRLCDWIKKHRHAATHLADIQSLRIPDKEIWKFAGGRGEIIVSKDMDFYERALIYENRLKRFSLRLGIAATMTHLRRWIPHGLPSNLN